MDDKFRFNLGEPVQLKFSGENGVVMVRVLNIRHRNRRIWSATRLQTVGR
jgi:hypothetical protein